jgi:hypothetical protein
MSSAPGGTSMREGARRVAAAITAVLLVLVLAVVVITLL